MVVIKDRHFVEVAIGIHDEVEKRHDTFKKLNNRLFVDANFFSKQTIFCDFTIL